MSDHSPRFVLFVWWITCLIWSSVWLFIKIGVARCAAGDFASVRLVVALMVLLPVIAWQGGRCRAGRATGC